jgi:hypothetical protein
MVIFTVVPLVGVGPVRLRMSRDAVHRELGPPDIAFMKTTESHWPTDAWMENCFQVFYSGSAPTVNFIELSKGGPLEASCFGISVFQTRIEQVIAAISKQADLDTTDPEHGSAFTFPRLELSFWRPHDDDRFFRTVGIGVPGYYSVKHSV